MTPQIPLSRQIAKALTIVYVIIGLITIALMVVGLKSIMHTFAYGIILAVSYIVILPLLAYASIDRPVVQKINVVVINIVVFFTLLLYIGAYNPFILAWAVVLIISYFYFGLYMAIISGVLLFIETAWTLAVYYHILEAQFITYVVLSMIVAGTGIVLGIFIIRMIKRTNDKTQKLAESKKAEELQLNRLNTLLNSISDTVLTLNRYGRVTSENSAALSFFDTNQSLDGKNIDDLLQVKDSAMQPVSIRKLAQNMHGSVYRDDLSIAAEGEMEIIRLSVQISAIHGTYGDDDGGCVVIIRDITRQKTLEDEKDEFISVTSHELRTPIAIAEGSLSNLLYAFEKKADPEKLAASAVAAHDQILYLARMINDLSTLSRAERGVGDTPEEIDLNNMLQELYLRYQPEAAAKSLSLNIDLDHLPTITTSRLYLEEILQNFLTNAIKYTKEGTVTLSGKLASDGVRFAVSDTGIGISRADREKIFEKFFRSEDYRTRETSGTGLGLYVVRKLADKLNTKVEVESRLNHGSTFAFTMAVTKNAPVVDAAAEKSPELGQTPSPASDETQEEDETEPFSSPTS